MKTFLCNECGKFFAEEAYLHLHQSRTHDLNSFSCEKCGDNVIGKHYLSNHTRKPNSAEGKLKKIRKCDVCPYETKDQANLSKHTKRVHSEKPQKIKKSRECSDCGKNFSRKDKFDNHVKVHHKAAAPLETCKECDYRCFESADLKTHMNSVQCTMYSVHAKTKRVKS